MPSFPKVSDDDFCSEFKSIFLLRSPVASAPRSLSTYLSDRGQSNLLCPARGIFCESRWAIPWIVPTEGGVGCRCGHGDHIADDTEGLPFGG